MIYTIYAIIQARMGSTRLPKKMTKMLAGKPLLQHVIDRVKETKQVDRIVLATTSNKSDKLLLRKAKELGIEGFAGNENDVLDRYYQCAKKYNATTIVRITGDCPLIDPEIIDKVIMLFKKSKADYASNIHPPTYPDGMDVEVFSFAALEKAWKEAKLGSEREHATPYIWKNKKRFRQTNLENDEDLSAIRLTVDEKKDFRLISGLLQKIKKEDFRLMDIIGVIKINPNLMELNKEFERNEGYYKSVKEDARRRVKSS